MDGSQLCSRQQFSLWLRQEDHRDARCAKFLAFTLTQATAARRAYEQTRFVVNRCDGPPTTGTCALFGHAAHVGQLAGAFRRSIADDYSSGLVAGTLPLRPSGG